MSTDDAGTAIMPSQCDSTMGFTVLELADGRSSWKWTIKDDRFNNPIGTVHGGFLATFADEVMGSCMATTLKPGESFTTAELKINYMKPVGKETISGEGTVIRRGRNIGFLEAKLTNEGGDLVATATSTVVLLRQQ
ncbi:MAG: PaaI family thioesterase [Candidatus Geothermincolia bacterium]